MSSICSVGSKVLLVGASAALCYFYPAFGFTVAAGIGTVAATKSIWQRFQGQPHPAAIPAARPPADNRGAAAQGANRFAREMSDAEAIAAIEAVYAAQRDDRNDPDLTEAELAMIAADMVDGEEKHFEEKHFAPAARLMEPHQAHEAIDRTESEHECPLSGEKIPELFLIDLNDGRGDPQYCDVRFLVKSLLNDKNPLNPFTKVRLEKGDLILLCAKLGIQEDEFTEIFKGEIPRGILAEKRRNHQQNAQTELEQDPAYQALAGAVQDDHYVQEMTAVLQQHQVVEKDVQSSARLELFGRTLRLYAPHSPLASELVRYYEENGLISVPRLDQI